VDQLRDDGRLRHALTAGITELGREQHQQGPHSLAAGGRQMPGECPHPVVGRVTRTFPQQPLRVGERPAQPVLETRHIGSEPAQQLGRDRAAGAAHHGGRELVQLLCGHEGTHPVGAASGSGSTAQVLRRFRPQPLQSPPRGTTELARRCQERAPRRASAGRGRGGPEPRGARNGTPAGIHLRARQLDASFRRRPTAGERARTTIVAPLHPLRRSLPPCSDGSDGPPSNTPG